MIAAILAAVVTFATITPTAINTAAHSTVILWGDYHDHQKGRMVFKGSDTLEPINIIDTNVDIYNKPFCSGFVVASHGTTETIVTAGHCARMKHFHEILHTGDCAEGCWGDLLHTGEEGVVPQRAQFEDGDVGTIKSFRISSTYDVAVLTVHSMRRHPVVTQGPEIQRGQNLFVFGMPGLTPWVYSPATSQQGPMYSGQMFMKPDEEEAFKPFRFMYALSCASCGPGDSGAGVFDADGHWVGVLSSGRSYPAQSLIVPGADVAATINQSSHGTYSRR